MAATLTQTINLIIQFTMLPILGLGYYFFRKKNYLWHAQLMTMGFILIITSFLIVMIPSLVMNYMTFLEPTTMVFDTASIAHIPIGIAGLVLGGFLVGRWARNDYRLNNMKATFLMRSTTIIWSISVIVGAVIYFTMPS